MKRFLALLFMLVLSVSAVAFSCAEESVPTVYSYDFDFRFHMNADVFPVQNRTHMQGYADLLNMLELKGNLTYSPSTGSFNINAEIIPVTNPGASVSFRLYGIPDYIGLSSPLLGDETIWFQNPFLMEFAFKTWNNLRIPLQYVALLYPYVTESAFRQMSNAWNVRFGAVSESVSFSRDELVSLVENWSSILHDDSQLKYWIYSISLPAKNGDLMETEFFRLPDYVLSRVFPEGGLRCMLDDSTETWLNDQNDLLFTRTIESGSSEWTLSLPETESGYLPRVTFRSVNDSRFFSLSLDGSYNLSESQVSNRSPLPESLFSLFLDMNGWPAFWPMDAAFDASLSIGGILYPNATMTLRGNSRTDGSFSLVISEPVEESGTSLEVFSCSGTVIPVAPSGVPDYKRDDFVSYLSIFNVSDQSKDDFVHRIRRPLFLGILNFLDEVPARACQSVMDDLEDYGVLDMILID